MHTAHVLVGPTAVGKTAVAHVLSARTGWPILSADAMQVYRGMDIGTAKPTREERSRFRYAGVDLVEANEPFDLARYLAYARGLPSGDWIVVGGSGLYVRALVEGLDDEAPADPALRARAETMLAGEGVQALQAWLQRVDPRALAQLADPCNPRRLIRALERGIRGVPARLKNHTPASAVVAGLSMDRAMLSERIARRARMMYDAGLVGETRDLLARLTCFSPTAAGAIGYAEAAEVLSGRLDLQAGLLRTIVRTRQLAKKQMTWFRHQSRVDWIQAGNSDEVQRLADEVWSRWSKHGAATLAV